MLEALIQFFVVFILVWTTYYIFILRKLKKDKKPMKEYMELSYLKNLYRLDMRKINKTKIMYIVSTINSFIIALTSSVVLLFDGMWLQMIVSILLLFVLIVLSYHILGSSLRKKEEKNV